MPAYYYECDCGQKTELICSIADLDLKEKAIKCSKCKKHKGLRRIYNGEVCATAFMPKTVGSLADKNSSLFSSDYKAHLEEQSRVYDPQEKSWTSTPEGMVHKSKLNKLKSKKKGKKRE